MALTTLSSDASPPSRSGYCHEQVAIYQMAASNRSRALHARRKIINKWADARKRWRGAPGISAASIVKSQAGFEKLAGADAFVTNLRANPGEQPRPLRIAAVVDVEAALPDLRAVIAQYSLIPGLV